MAKEAHLSIPFSWNQQSYLAHCKAAEKRKDCKDCRKGDTAKKLRCAYKPHTEGKCPELSQRLTVFKTFSTAHVSSKWRCGNIVIETKLQAFPPTSKYLREHVLNSHPFSQLYGCSSDWKSLQEVCCCAAASFACAFWMLAHAGLSGR